MRPEYRALPNVFLLPHRHRYHRNAHADGYRGLDNVDAALDGRHQEIC